MLLGKLFRVKSACQRNTPANTRYTTSDANATRLISSVSTQKYKITDTNSPGCPSPTDSEVKRKMFSSAIESSWKPFVLRLILASNDSVMLTRLTRLCR